MSIDSDMDIHVFLHSATDDAKLDKILNKLNQLITLENTEISKMTVIEDKLAALEQEVAENATVIGSAEALLAGLSQQLKDAIAAGGNAEALASRVQAVSDALDAKTNELAAAVAANTPAPPTP